MWRRSDIELEPVLGQGRDRDPAALAIEADVGRRREAAEQLA